MEKFIEFLKTKNLPNKKSLGGFFVGEKTLWLAMQEKFVLLCGDFVTASKLKRGLAQCNKKVEIISCGRENEDEHDVNLFAFAQNVGLFLDGQIDGLIFLPSSLSCKFDLDFLRQKFEISVGMQIEIDVLCQNLVEFGFERVDYVSAFGQFAVRGDVVDVFCEQDSPLRIEFFDDEIEKIINFDFSNMKTLKTCEKAAFSPIFLKFGKNSVLDICPNVVVDEPAKIENECIILEKGREEFEWHKKDLFLNFSSIDLSKAVVFFNTLDCAFENKTVGQKSYITDFLGLKRDIQMFTQSGNTVFLFAGEFLEILQEFLTTNSIAFQRLDDFLLDQETKAEKKTSAARVVLCAEHFSVSFSFLDKGIIGIGTDDMYKSAKVDFRSGKQNFSYLPKVGDFVVHAFYGVGRCQNIVRMKLSHFEKDYFVLEYKNGALLYLPTEQANLLTAYIGGENPKLNALGSSEWTKLKQKVKADLKEIAVTLAKIYKEREQKKGFAFSRDEDLEKQFSDACPFDLTADQAQAVQDVDADMESNKIMDRLICGDVGFGKTEVAFRAIFKAVYNGKQVAFLCPTTILSEQHFRSCQTRFDGFGLRIAVLNRFKSAKETQEIYRKVERGEVDILVGTHKILNVNLHFKDLGLLVLDEEQRFGVKDKEKIKKIKTDVDVLTLSATPIPRTLHMSLSGIRDISVIATPPKDRLPIQTYVTQYSDDLLRDVTARELSRGGKALVLFNRVAEIEHFRARVSELLPNARIGVAHGQMEERELARVIADLYDDKFNVLISTTLIENGIDLPTLNTLFVVDCDMLGLGQLYQIRGRIGRSDKLAYAYLTYNGGKVLTEEAYKRLEAIKEFRELGSGFKIAMRDLEIRGAGNILGKEQHGHMQKVGYDMYVRLLEEVTREVAGEKTAAEKEIKMELVLDAFISEQYIPSQDERIIYYSRISKIASQGEFAQTINSLKEQYGDMPREVENLCRIAYLKNLASNFNVKKIVINSSDCNVHLYKSEQVIDERLSKISGFYDARLKFEETPILKLNFTGKVIDKVKKLTEMFEKALQM